MCITFGLAHFKPFMFHVSPTIQLIWRKSLILLFCISIGAMQAKWKLLPNVKGYLPSFDFLLFVICDHWMHVKRTLCVHNTITIMFQQVWNSRHVPKSWKVCLIKLLPKVPCSSPFNQWRSISLRGGEDVGYVLRSLQIGYRNIQP